MVGEPIIIISTSYGISQAQQNDATPPPRDRPPDRPWHGSPRSGRANASNSALAKPSAATDGLPRRSPPGYKRGRGYGSAGVQPERGRHRTDGRDRRPYAQEYQKS